MGGTLMLRHLLNEILRNASLQEQGSGNNNVSKGNEENRRGNLLPVILSSLANVGDLPLVEALLLESRLTERPETIDELAKNKVEENNEKRNALTNEFVTGGGGGGGSPPQRGKKRRSAR